MYIFISVCQIKSTVTIKITFIFDEVYFKSEKVRVSVHSWKIMGLGLFRASSPLFFRNGQILRLSPINLVDLLLYGKPHCSNFRTVICFRTITAIFSGVWIFQIFILNFTDHVKARTLLTLCLLYCLSLIHTLSENKICGTYCFYTCHMSIPVNFLKTSWGRKRENDHIQWTF